MEQTTALQHTSNTKVCAHRIWLVHDASAKLAANLAATQARSALQWQESTMTIQTCKREMQLSHGTDLRDATSA